MNVVVHNNHDKQPHKDNVFRLPTERHLHHLTLPTFSVNIAPMAELIEVPKPKKFIDKIIDASVDGLSSSKAIYLQTAVTVGYVVLNSVTFAAIKQFDPYPFLFLNFLYSIMSGYATVLVLNSNRRQEEAAKVRNANLIRDMKELVLENRRQSEMLEMLTGMRKEDSHAKRG